MKIGIFTFFDNGNFGSELQAYALKNKIEEKGHEVFNIKIKEKSKIIKLIVKIKIIITVLIHSIKYPDLAKNFISLQNSASSARKISCETREKIHNFSKNNLKHLFLSRMELRESVKNKEFDCYICGSDQVWSPLRKPFIERHLYLNFVDADKKIAYAPSFGINTVPEYSKKRILHDIGKFKYLSIREGNGKNYLKENGNIDAQLVVDPTLLYDRVFWEKKIYETTNININSPYIFCYFLGGLTEETYVYIRNFALKKNLKVIMLPFKEYSTQYENIDYYDCNPIEFISLIKNSSYVFTDSFHGSVFSVIFHKNFVALKRQQNEAATQTGRITDLLNDINLNDRYISDLSKMESVMENVIDFEYADKIIEEKRQKSLAFLYSSLDDVEGCRR